MEFTDFEEKFKDKEPREAMSSAYMKRENLEQKIYVFYVPKTDKFTKEDLKSRIEIMKTQTISNAIIILQGETSVVRLLFYISDCFLKYS